MKVVTIPNASGIDDVKLIGETDTERAFIRQLAEAGTLSSISRSLADSVTFRAISTSGATSGSYTSATSLGKYNFTLIQNQNFLVDLKLLKAGAPLDLSVFSAIKLQVKNANGSVIFGVSLASGLEVKGDDLNILGIVFTPAQTVLLCQDTYYYDIEFQKPTSNTYYVEGKITVKKTVTR